MMSGKHWLRPTYGQRFRIKPKRWWKPGDRRAARQVAAILDSSRDHGGVRHHHINGWDFA